MTLNFSETYQELDSDQLDVMRSMPSWRKFKIVNDLIVYTRRSIMERLRDHYPHDQPEKIRRRFATVWLGAELAANVYGPESDPPTIEIPIKTLWYVPPRNSPKGSAPSI
jgi:hypothetical protein